MRLVASTLLLVLSLTARAAGQENLTGVAIVSHVVEPEALPVTDQAIAGLKVPSGFTVKPFAKDLGNPRMLAVAPDGSVYVSRREQGDILLLRDSDGDGSADPPIVVARRPDAHGLAVTATHLYLVTVTDVFVAERRTDGRLGTLRRIVSDLPHAGQHPNRTIAIGPDGQLYVSVGSTCNACDETSPEHATLLQITPDGQSRVIHASGLRNTIGFAWHPTTGALFGFDHGIDWLGDDAQPEELNQIVQGKQYGWPYIYADDKENPQDEPPGGITPATWARMSVAPVLTYTAHAAPMQMVFYDGSQFPPDYRHDAFVAMHGSWNRKTPSGYEVVRVRFDGGAPVAVEPFLTGFLREQSPGRWGVLGRPVGLAVMPDGALLVGDDENGVIYRVSHGTGNRDASSVPRRTAVTPPRLRAPAPRPLATSQVAAPIALRVTASAFGNGGTIPVPHSDYGEKFSPALAWSGAPDKTASFVVLMEDADARTPRPFVHWVLYNLPGTVTTLDDGVPARPRLPELRNALQGRTSRGNFGYFGPRPPRGDAPHAYHFQVFALDALLSLDPGATAEQVLAAMRGHVLAAGTIVGTFGAPKPN